MLIILNKFGTTLTSRQAGREAFAAFQPGLNEAGSDEKVEIDFSGVITFSPSWADEFLSPLHERFGDRLVLRASENPSVTLTLHMLEKIRAFTFMVKKGGGS